MNRNRVFIKIDRITKNYQDPQTKINFQAISGIDLVIPEGSFNVIIGPSGAGKTTLLGIIGGNNQPSTGTVVVDGVELNKLNPHDMSQYRRHICGYMWQESSDNLIMEMTVDQNLDQVMSIAGYPKSKRKERKDNLLESFEILDRRHHRINQLSGGEALRASLAVALANDPKILIADEPTGELDGKTAGEIRDYLEFISKELGVTVIVATHDPDFDKISDRTYILLDGLIIGMKTKNGQQDDSSIAMINALGQIQLPQELREKYGFSEFVKLVEDPEHGRLIVEPIKDTDKEQIK